MIIRHITYDGNHFHCMMKMTTIFYFYLNVKRKLLQIILIHILILILHFPNESKYLQKASWRLSCAHASRCLLQSQFTFKILYISFKHVQPRRIRPFTYINVLSICICHNNEIWCHIMKINYIPILYFGSGATVSLSLLHYIRIQQYWWLQKSGNSRL